MGNCVQSCKNRPQVDRVSPFDEENQLQIEKAENGVAGRRRRVKILLTKDESEWLMLGLKETQGKKLEELLGEIVRKRERSSASVGWKPCLDSITEIGSQVPEGMAR